MNQLKFRVDEDGEREMRDTPKQGNVIITLKELRQPIARMSNWKAAAPDHVQEFWFKKVMSLLKLYLQE